MKRRENIAHFPCSCPRSLLNHVEIVKQENGHSNADSYSQQMCEEEIRQRTTFPQQEIQEACLLFRIRWITCPKNKTIDSISSHRPFGERFTYEANFSPRGLKFLPKQDFWWVNVSKPYLPW